MPYPLENLPYGLRNRLRELATPTEAYAFQIAAPDYIGIQPMQLIQRINECIIHVDAQEAELWAQHDIHDTIRLLDITDTSLYEINEVWIVQDGQKRVRNIETYPIFNHVRLSPLSVTFAYCHISKTFLTSLHRSVTELSFAFCTFDFENAFELICDTFKSLTSLTFDGNCPIKNNWLELLTNAKLVNMKVMLFHKVSQDVLDVDKEMLIKFLKAQRDDFRFDIMLGEPENYDRLYYQLDTLFEPHLFDALECHVSGYKSVNVFWDDKTSFYTHNQRFHMFRDDIW